MKDEISTLRLRLREAIEKRLIYKLIEKINIFQSDII